MRSVRLIAVLTASLAVAASGQPSGTAGPPADPARADALVARGQYDAAEPIVLGDYEALVRNAGPEDPRTLAAAIRLGILRTGQGRFAEAETLLQRAVLGLERAAGRDHADTLRALNALSRLYERQRRLGEVEPIVLRIMETSERTLGTDHPLTLQAINNLAVLRFRAGQLQEAEPLLVRNLAARERVLGADHADTLNGLGNLADLRDRLGRTAEAEALFLRAFEAARGRYGLAHPVTLNAIGGLAGHYRRRRRFAEAEPLLDRLAGAYQRLHGDSHPATIGAVQALAEVRLALPGRAADALPAARLVVAGLRTRQRDGADLLFAAEQAEREREGLADGYLTLADAAYAALQRDRAQGPQLAAEAFAALQDSMTGAAGQAIVQMAARRRAERSEPGLGALIRERDAAARAWSANAADYSAVLGGSDDVAAELRGELAAARPAIEARLRALDARLRADFPRYAAMARPEPVGLEAARALLRSDEALLMIVPTRSGTHLFAVSRGDMRWVRTPPTRAQVNGAVRRLLWDAGARVPASPEEQARWLAASREGRAFDRRTAYEVHQQLVAPVASVLAGKRHVFVIAAGRLAQLPLGLLVAAPPAGDDADPAALRATAWLADRYALIQIPSLQSLHFQRRFARPARAGAAGTGFVGFGDPLLDGAAATRGRGAIAASRDLRRLARLPGTAVELERMRVALGAPAEALYLRERATEQRLRSMDLTGIRILALATHGLTAGEVGSAPEPGLVLTPPASPGEQDDGYLSASEVASLDLDADWVILSACNTAAGASDDAPGLSGLARAFFYAGARTLLASHWPVRDDVAPVLTVRILELQRADPALSRAEAFQRAMREVRGDTGHDPGGESWAHPNAWAAFTLIGDGAS
ncbi:MAG TPA: CHAT domain-containing tetratricopeptide repeat protein [Allosphingosinicella sp.]|nr:CHAT domain-containing tetratricopeptide repeat protein [Allosphingosinicella sp.]